MFGGTVTVKAGMKEQRLWEKKEQKFPRSEGGLARAGSQETRLQIRSHWVSVRPEYPPDRVNFSKYRPWTPDLTITWESIRNRSAWIHLVGGPWESDLLTHHPRGPLILLKLKKKKNAVTSWADKESTYLEKWPILNKLAQQVNYRLYKWGPSQQHQLISHPTQAHWCLQTLSLCSHSHLSKVLSAVLVESLIGKAGCS